MSSSPLPPPHPRPLPPRPRPPPAAPAPASAALSRIRSLIRPSSCRPALSVRARGAAEAEQGGRVTAEVIREAQRDGHTRTAVTFFLVGAICGTMQRYGREGRCIAWPLGSARRPEAPRSFRGLNMIIYKITTHNACLILTHGRAGPPASRSGVAPRGRRGCDTPTITCTDNTASRSRSTRRTTTCGKATTCNKHDDM